MAQFSSDSVAICYVLPVLWMMPYFHIMVSMGRQARRYAVCRVVLQVGVATGRAPAAAAYWLGGLACWGIAGCLAAGLGCFWDGDARIGKKVVFAEKCITYMHTNHLGCSDQAGCCNPVGPVVVNPGSVVAVNRRPTPIATMQIDFIHSASAIGTLTVQKEFEIATLEDILCC